MKNILFAIPAFLSIFLFTGCEKLKEQKFGVQLISDFVIDLNDGETSYSSEELLSTLTNDDLAQYAENIKDYSLEKLSYKIWEYNGPDLATIQGNLKIENPGAANDLVTIDITQALLFDLNAQEERTTVDLDQSDINKIVSYLQAGNEIRLKSEGLISESPAYMVLQVVMDLEATAKIK